MRKGKEIREDRGDAEIRGAGGEGEKEDDYKPNLAKPSKVQSDGNVHSCIVLLYLRQRRPNLTRMKN